MRLPLEMTGMTRLALFALLAPFALASVSFADVTTVTAVEPGAIAADVFAVPAGYKFKEQK